MSLTITQVEKIVNGFLTKPVAARTQIRYVMQREDFNVAQVIDSIAVPGNVQLNLGPAVDNSSLYNVGDSVYYTSDVYPSGLYTVEAVDFDNPPGPFRTQVTINLLFTADSPSSKLNLISGRPAYNVSIEIFDDDLGVQIGTQPLRYVPNQAGELTVDLSSIIGGFMSNPDSTVFSLQFHLSVTEVWEGSSELPQTTTVIQGILGQEQLLHRGGALMYESLLKTWVDQPLADLTQDLGGGNTRFIFLNNVDYTAQIINGETVTLTGIAPYADGDYVIFFHDFLANTVIDVLDLAFIGNLDQSNSPRAATQQGQISTKFENPVLWRGWNMTIAIIKDAELSTRNSASTTIVWRIQDADINKVEFGAVESPTNTDTNTVVIKSIEPQAGSAAFVSVAALNFNGSLFISEVIYIKVERECPNPIMLDWINTSGAPSQWLFGVNQIVTNTVGQGVVVERPIVDDIATITNTKRRFPGPTVQRITMAAEHLLIDQLDALREIKETQSLRVYITKDGTEFIDGIVVGDLTVENQTELNLFSFTVTVEFPDDFNFLDAKKY